MVLDQAVDKTLVLNFDYTPIDIWSFKRAFSNIWLGKAVMVVNKGYILDSKGKYWDKPAVIALKRYININKHKPRCNKFNVYLRDDGFCQYCYKKITISQCTLDHVIPRSLGGETTFLNVVACCTFCNSYKQNKPLEKSGMRLYKKPESISFSHLLNKKIEYFNFSLWENND